ncbi:MAG: hypothetical protein H6996_09230 [Moraxellaceae bacterium]|nr:hypothetical protein [Pseudomonadales bacterium]MCB1674413.1 hypothetical protein [Pseudomonadales bacterium]MCP5175273.1 hypothetical protein [Moraxellaceae bacterium]MCP5177026.1 hypothetical protein [Moraxellaceae bacterium]HQV22885.1 hypothetical protein [Agitococcus sp.]
MAIELGNHFPQRWQYAPSELRQKIFDELQDICLSLGGVIAERVIANPTKKRPVMPPARPPVTSVPPSALEQELKKRFLQNADDLIEEHLDKVREDLRRWLHGEMNQLLSDSLKKADAS